MKDTILKVTAEECKQLRSQRAETPGKFRSEIVRFATRHYRICILAMRYQSTRIAIAFPITRRRARHLGMKLLLG